MGPDRLWFPTGGFVTDLPPLTDLLVAIIVAACGRTIVTPGVPDSPVGRTRDGLFEAFCAFCKPGTCVHFQSLTPHRFDRLPPNCLRWSARRIWSRSNLFKTCHGKIGLL